MKPGRLAALTMALNAICGKRCIYGIGDSFHYSYVRAMIVTEIHALQVYLGDELVEVLEYRLPAEISS